MTQPKFKMGQRLIKFNNSASLTVRKIEQCKRTKAYQYADFNGVFYEESSLVENNGPQTLYAWELPNNEIKWTTNSEVFHGCSNRGPTEPIAFAERRPEFDKRFYI